MEDIRICFVGDSFVNGTCDPDGLGWVGRVIADTKKKHCELTYYNLGIRGDTSRMILTRWQNECLQRLPVHSDNRVVFSFGVNDTVIEKDQQRVDLVSSVENAKKILLIAVSQYKVVMIGPPPINDPEQNKRIKLLDDSYQRLCHQLDVDYLSIYSILLKDDVWMKEVMNNDGAHPGAGGYSRLSKIVISWEKWWF